MTIDLARARETGCPAAGWGATTERDAGRDCVHVRVRLDLRLCFLGSDVEDGAKLGQGE
jgi:hypothetical protein